jgi:hypothetical protein
MLPSVVASELEQVAADAIRIDRRRHRRGERDGDGGWHRTRVSGGPTFRPEQLISRHGGGHGRAFHKGSTEGGCVEQPPPGPGTIHAPLQPEPGAAAHRPHRLHHEVGRQAQLAAELSLHAQEAA